MTAKGVLIVTDNQIYTERVSSNRTEALFVGLTCLFYTLFVRRRLAGRQGVLTATFCFLGSFFFFYSLNYRTLTIRLTPDSLQLTFGIFSWKVPLDNIADCRLDDMPLLPRMGGAGIHFMLVEKRYRALFNFLEHPRVVVGLKRKAGPVQDISFSTRQPDDVLHLITEAISAKSKSQLDGLLSV
jgi:hypothetical protein